MNSDLPTSGDYAWAAANSAQDEANRNARRLSEAEDKIEELKSHLNMVVEVINAMGDELFGEQSWPESVVKVVRQFDKETNESARKR